MNQKEIDFESGLWGPKLYDRAMALAPKIPGRTKWDELMEYAKKKQVQLSENQERKAEMKRQETQLTLVQTQKKRDDEQQLLSKLQRDLALMTRKSGPNLGERFQRTVQIVEQIRSIFGSGSSELGGLRVYDELQFDPKCREAKADVKQLTSLLGSAEEAQKLLDSPETFNVQVDGPGKRMAVELAKKVIINSQKGCSPNATLPDRDESILPYQKLAGYLMWPDLDRRGILLLHPVGSGKTCTAISSINSLIEAMIMGREQGINKVYIINPKPNLNADYFNDLKCRCGSAELSDAVMRDEYTITKKFTDLKGEVRTLEIKFLIYTRQIPSQDVFENSLVIFDECHNMMNPKSSNHFANLNAMYLRYVLLHTKKVKIVLASATPIEDHPSELALLNIIKPRDADNKIINPYPDEYMSHTELGKPNNNHISPQYEWFHREKRGALKQQRREMFDKEYKQVDGLLTDEAKSKIGGLSRGLVSFINIQKIGRGNVYPQIRVGSNGLEGEDLETLTQAVQDNDIQKVPSVDVIRVTESKKGKVTQIKAPTTKAGAYTPWNSPDTVKLQKVVDNITKLASSDGVELDDVGSGQTVVETANKQCIWANDAQTFRAIAQLLEKSGFEIYYLLNIQNSKWRHLINNVMIPKLLEFDDGTDDSKKRAAQAWIDRMKARKDRKKAFLMYERALSDDKHATTPKELWLKDVVNQIYNHKENVNGDFAHGIIIGNSAREGKSFFETTHMHLVDMPPKRSQEELEAIMSGTFEQSAASKTKNVYNMSMRNQVMGRISRMYSHCKLKPEDRYVRFFAYATQLNGGPKTAEERSIEDSGHVTTADETITVLQDNSVDATLWKDAQPRVRGEYSDPHGPVCGHKSFEFDLTKQHFGIHTPNKPEPMYLQTAPVFTAQMTRNTEKFDPLVIGIECRQRGDVFVHPPPTWTEEYESAFQSILQAQQAQESTCKLPLTNSNVEWAKDRIRRAFNSKDVHHSGEGFVFDTRPPASNMQNWISDKLSSAKNWYTELQAPAMIETGSGETTLYVSYKTLMGEWVQDDEQWWSANVDNSGVITQWGLHEAQDLRKNNIPQYSNKMLIPRFCNDGMYAHINNDPTAALLLKDVETELMKRAVKIRDMSKYAIGSVFSFKDVDWERMYDDWASFGKVPTDHWDSRSVTDRERAHGLGLMIRMRGALLSEAAQIEMFKKVALKRAIEASEKIIAQLTAHINKSKG